MVAAATTSLPETPGGERNWDYRYTLDPRLHVHAVGALHARLRLGGQRLLLLHRRRRRARARATSRSCTAIDGERQARPSSTLDHLSGYEGARPVRIGNGAYDQDQHDVWGAVLDSVYLHTKSRDHLPERIWPILKRQVEARARALARARPRHLGGPRRAAALHLVEADVLGRARPRRAAGRAARGARAAPRAGRRRPTRSTPTSATTRVDERGVFCQHYDTDALDASVLLMPLVALPAARRRAHPRRPCWRSPTS